MKHEIEIKNCFYSCPFFRSSHGEGMYCSHPIWQTIPNRTGWEGFFITHDNSKDRVPDECPLKNETLQIEYKLSEEVK